MNTLLKSIIRKLVYAGIFCILLIAVFIILAWILSPVLNSHRTDFEKWASALLNTPVTIEEVRLSWYHYQPEISLKQVTILDKQNKTPALQIRQVQIFFSIPESIWQRKIVPKGVMITGANADIYRTASGEFKMHGFPSLSGFSDQPLQSETQIPDMIAWLSSQPRLSLRDIDIRYMPAKGEKRFITLYKLSFINDGSSHVILGNVLLRQAMPTEIKIVSQWEGNEINLNKIKAHIYLAVTGFNLPQWLKDFTFHQWQIKQGLISAKIWVDWQTGTLQKIQSEFQAYGLTLFAVRDRSLHKINRLSGHVGMQINEDEMQIAGEDILIDLPNHLWPLTQFNFSFIANNQPATLLKLHAPSNENTFPNLIGSKNFKLRKINLGYVDLKDIQSFLFLTDDFLTQPLRDTFAQLKLSGTLQNTNVTFLSESDAVPSLTFDTDFAQINFAKWRGFPGIENLSGHMAWQQDKGMLHVKSKQFKLDDPSLFASPILLSQLDSIIQIKHQENKNWLATIQQLAMMNDDMDATVLGLITVNRDQEITTDLTANFNVADVRHINKYLPVKLFSNGLVSWLKQAFLSGELRSGHLILRGPLKEFPFANEHDEFKVTGVVDKLELNYAPDWPHLKNIAADLTFSGRKLTVDLHHAEMLDIQINKASGFIPNISGSDNRPIILEVKSEPLTTDLSKGLNFIMQTPLKKIFGKVLKDTQATGPITLLLDLTVPIDNPSETHVFSKMSLNKNDVNLKNWNLQLTDVTGDLNFTEKSASADQIFGKVFNKPFAMTVSTINKNKTNVIEANIKNKIAINDLQDWLEIPLSPIFQGETDLVTTLQFSFNEPFAIHLVSNLVGIKINLSTELKKQAQTPHEFFADLFLNGNDQLRLKLNYDKSVSSALILNAKRGKYELTSVNLQLNGGEAEWPKEPGLFVSGRFKTITWNDIKNYWNMKPDHKALPSLPLQGMDLFIKQLNLLGQQIDDLHVQVAQQANQWGVDLESTAISGHLAIPTKLDDAKIIEAQFDHFNLLTNPTDLGLTPKFDVKEIPALRFAAKSVMYNQIHVGQVNFEVAPNDNSLDITALQVLSPYINLQAKGELLPSNENLQMQLAGKMLSNNVSAWLTGLGFDVKNFIVRQGQIDFDLNWQTTSLFPVLASLNGKASMVLGAGRIVDVGEASDAKMDLGRMLSLFSLQSIPRRLTLDFSDLFQKGYSFDLIRGNFSFRNGDAFTNNLQIAGPLAQVAIKGRIGLKDKDYDLIVSVTPNVTSMTSSIPVAATLITVQPLVGLAALAVNQMVGPQVSKYTTYHYTVRGPWANPIWETQSGKK